MPTYIGARKYNSPELAHNTKQAPLHPLLLPDKLPAKANN